MIVRERVSECVCVRARSCGGGGGAVLEAGAKERSFRRGLAVYEFYLNIFFKFDGTSDYRISPRDRSMTSGSACSMKFCCCLL